MHSKYTSTRIACYIGYVVQAITINLSPLFFVIFQNRYHVSLAQLSQLVFVTFAIQFCVDLAAVRLMDKIGYRAAAVIAHGMATLGLVLLSFLPAALPDPYIGILLSTACFSIGGGFTEVFISPLIDSLPSDAKASSMSLLHSFYCWGQFAVVLLTTVALFFIGDGNWFFLPLFWALIPAVNLVFFLLVPIPKSGAPAGKNTSFSGMLKSGLFYFFLVLMICGGAAEQAMSQWASLFAEKALGVSKILGDLLGPCLFAVFMGSGRVLYGVFGKKIRIEPALLGCSVLALLCYLLSVFSTVPVLSLIGCAVCGLGVSLMWPGVLSATSARFSHGGNSMFALLALGGDAGCTLGPWITGIVGDAAKNKIPAEWIGVGTDPEQIALKCGMLAAAVFQLVMTVILSAFLLKKKKRP